MHAKSVSKATMLLASVWIAVLTLMKGLGKIDLSVRDIVVAALVIVSLWCPTYVSVYLDKWKELKELK